MWKTDGKGRVLGHLCGEKRPLTVENCVKSGEISTEWVDLSNVK